MLFEEINNDIEKRADQNQIRNMKSNVDFDQFALINPELFRSRINEIDSMDDKELYTLIKETYKTILSDIMNKNDEDYIRAFIKPRFLKYLIQVVTNQTLSYNERLCCNKLAYDYFTYVQNPDREIQELFYVLSEKINNLEIYRLTAIGVSTDYAIKLALARYGYIDEIINVKRVNFVIANMPREMVTNNLVIQIYSILFDHFIPIFEGFVFDVFDEDEEWVTDDIIENYDTMYIVILNILNEMELTKIRKILVSYVGNFKTIYCGDRSKIRFSLRSLSEDYRRIRCVIEDLDREKIIVP